MNESIKANLLMQNIKTKIVFYLPMIMLSFIVMLFYTRSSPLFFTNNWVDANAFMTVGKGIVHGLVPYKDLFEHKGPILYFIHSIAYISFPNTFYAIYIFESIAMALNMILFYKIARLFINKHFAYLLSFFLPVLILNYDYFRMGDSAEEFVFPCLMFLIYTILSCRQNHELSFSKRTLFLHGIILACIFWIKYTLIGAWIGFFAFYGIYLIWKRQFAKLGQSIMISLTGFIAVSLPVLIYFWINNALRDLFDVYFIFNITSYSTEHTLWYKIYRVLAFFLHPTSTSQYFISFLILAGIALIIFLNRKKDYTITALYIVSFISAGFFQYLGGHAYIKYYLLIVVPFAATGLTGFTWVLEKNIRINEKYLKAVYFLAPLLAIILPFLFNNNILYSRFFPNNSDKFVESPMNSNPNSTTSAQREFAEIINKVPNATLLNYGLDLGVYLAADILPNVRFFIQTNVDIKRNPINQLAQNSYIKEKRTDFVVLVENDRYNINLLEKNYQLVAVHLQTNEGKVDKYLLYQKRKNE
jgi:hypothetical protein